MPHDWKMLCIEDLGSDCDWDEVVPQSFPCNCARANFGSISLQRENLSQNCLESTCKCRARNRTGVAGLRGEDGEGFRRPVWTPVTGLGTRPST